MGGYSMQLACPFCDRCSDAHRRQLVHCASFVPTAHERSQGKIQSRFFGGDKEKSSRGYSPRRQKLIHWIDEYGHLCLSGPCERRRPKM